MKFLRVFILISCCCSGLANAQTFGFSSGIPVWQPLNHIINRYNDTRPWLTNQMNEIHFLPGVNIGFGMHEWDSKFSFDLFRLQWLRKTVKAEGQDQSRTMRVKFSTLSIIGFGYYPIAKSKFKLGFNLYPVELSRLKIKGKTSEEPDWKYYYKSASFFGIPTNASSTLTFDFLYLTSEKLHWQFRLYYLYSWFKDEEILFVNKELNPNTYQYTNQSQTLDCSHFGISISLGVH